MSCNHAVDQSFLLWLNQLMPMASCMILLARASIIELQRRESWSLAIGMYWWKRAKNSIGFSIFQFVITSFQSALSANFSRRAQSL